MTRINVLNTNVSRLVFAAVLIICSITVGCSSEAPKPVNSSAQIPAPQAQPQPMPATPATQAENKPVARKPVVRKKPATVNYADKTYGVTFEYPRRYAIETGDAATQLIMANPMPMNFVQPGGVALAAVELPETNYVNTDFSSAFFNVSVHKSLSSDECSQFAVPQLRSLAKSDAAPVSDVKVDGSKTEPATSEAKSEVKSETKTEAITEGAKQDPTAQADFSSTPKAEAAAKAMSGSNKLLLGDMELRATEAVSGEGTRQSDSKYFHVYQNGACYEFALNVTTDASEEGLVKHVDRDKVFNRLEQILATVKITSVAPEVKAESTPTETPAQP
jgi:hypothetical protein